MRKLLLVSILLATMILPMRMARDPVAWRGLRRTMVGMAVFVVVYALLIVYVYPRL